MNKIVVITCFMLIACSQSENVDYQKRAIDIPTKKVVITEFKEDNPSKIRFQKELSLVKVTHEKEVYLEYVHSLVGNEVFESYTIFPQNQEFILYEKDTCRLVSELEVLSGEDTTKVHLYKHDLANGMDEEALLVLNEKNEIAVMYNYPWRLVIQYDSKEKGKEYYKKLIEQLTTTLGRR